MLWILAACGATPPPPDPRHFALPWRGAPLPAVRGLDADAVTWTVVPQDAAFVKEGWLLWGSEGNAELSATAGDQRERWTFTALPPDPEELVELAQLLGGHECDGIFVYGPAPPLESPDRPFVPGEPSFVTRGVDGLVAASDARVYGGLVVGDVDAVLTPICPALASCAEDVPGYATVHMEIATDGRVVSSRVRRSSYGDAQRDACLHALLATATFPAAAYATDAEYTFTLTPR